jgi:hypothetical protein
MTSPLPTRWTLYNLTISSYSQDTLEADSKMAYPLSLSPKR